MPLTIFINSTFQFYVLSMFIYVHYIICCFPVMWATWQSPTWCQSPGEKWKKQMDHQHQNWKNEGGQQHQRFTQRWQFQRQWMSKWKMTREDITQTMIKRKRQLIKKQTKIRKDSMKRIQADPPRSIARLPAVCKGIVPRSWNGKPFSRNILTRMFFVVRFCTAKGCWFHMISMEKKLPPRFCWGSVWFFLNKQPLFGSLASFQILDRFQSDVFPPIMKVEAGPFGVNSQMPMKTWLMSWIYWPPFKAANKT